MLTPPTLLGYVKAEPFRPFRIEMASGRAHEIRHPEMIKVMKSHAVIFSLVDETDDLPDRFDTISLILSESICYLDSRASADHSWPGR